MCGIVGYWSQNERPSENLVARMATQIVHRGPDGHGTWIDGDAGVAFGHRRLAIIDLSEAGHQPMESADERYVVTYNGEIYNHMDLRRDLEQAGAAPQWRGHSDTETLVAAISHWGFRNSLQRLNGMFAFALWDKKTRRLSLARDRMGEKPLYYGFIGNTFFFGSELKAFKPHPQWHPEIDRRSIASYMRHNYVPGPASIYRNIHKLPPASCVTLGAPNEDRMPERYWDVDEVARAGTANPFAPDPVALEEQLDQLLRDSIKMRMAADVPLGAFLSGGYDSSIVAALMQAQSDVPIRTFTIGFNEKEYNEATHAKAVAKHLGTEHTEMYVSPEQARDVIPELAAIWDEPFADSSQIPTLLLSRLTKDHVTVSLSGDGGDELFCGYNRYAMGYEMWRRLGNLPPSARNSLAWAFERTPRKLATSIGNRLPGKFATQHLGDRLPKLAEVMRLSADKDYYKHLISHWNDPAALVLGATEQSNRELDGEGWEIVKSITDRMMLHDMKTYLPDDILTKVDRASMAVSLEARVPLLDHRLVEFAWKTPGQYKMRDGQGKWLLRNVLYRYVPREIMERPKMGFGVPIDAWLAGPLRDWAEALLDPKKLTEEGLLDPAPIRAKWEEHVSGKRRWHYHLWDVLMFQAWKQTQSG